MGLLQFGLVLAADEALGQTTNREWLMIGGIAGLFVLGLILVAYTTKAGIIARATTKEAIRQPVFLLCLALAIVIVVMNTFLPFYSLGEDVKMLKDCSLATILISGVLIAVWTASTSIADEIEGKTAMTLLSKPINRRQFVVGKYLGILQAVLWFMLPLAIVLLACVYYKIPYDARESSKDAPDIALRWAEVTQVIPGLLLLYMEVAVLAGISVAISTRLPMIVNLTTCFAIFVVGHLAGVLVTMSENRLEFVRFMSRLIATVLPSLEAFNVSAAVATGSFVPVNYLGPAAIYCACYCSATVLFALILFEDRDLA